jgi:hypothetical protein
VEVVRRGAGRQGRLARTQAHNTGRQTGRQAGRQADRQTYKQVKR